MRRITHLVFVAGLACGMQSALAEESMLEAGDATTSEAYSTVAAADAYLARDAWTAEGAKPAQRESLLEILGLSTGDGFPSKGGPID